MKKHDFIAGLGERLLDKEAIIGKWVAGPTIRAMRGLGMSPRRATQVGRFAATAAPMVAGSFLQRSENPLVSGVGSAMTFAPMFSGMTRGKVTSGPLSGNGKVPAGSPVPKTPAMKYPTPW